MAIALAAASCLGAGFLLTAAGVPQWYGNISSWLMRLSLAAGFGLGISSCSYFVARRAGGDHFFLADVLLLAVLFAWYVLTRFRPRDAMASGRPIADFALPRWLELVLTVSFISGTVTALYSSFVQMLAHEHGQGWDAFAIWNLHARFLFRSADHWRSGFNSLIPWSHPDYPLLLPAAVARFWSYLGHESTWVPGLIGIVFTFCTVSLLASSLAQLRGRNAAMLSGLALLTTPFFIEQGTAQYADVPLSFFILASIVLLQFGFRNHRQDDRGTKHGPWLLAGASAGFAAWTKNEGLLFLVALFFAHLWVLLPRRIPTTPENLPDRRWELLLSWLAGTIPILAVILWFKHSVAAAGDLVSDPAIMLGKLLTPSRYDTILRWYGKELLRFGEWWPVPETVLLAIFYFLVRKKKTGRDPLLRSSIAALTLTWAGFFVIYLVTPRDLNWHLRFSLNRLFLQLWPATIFLFFLFVGRPTPLSSQNEPKFATKP